MEVGDIEKTRAGLTSLRALFDQTGQAGHRFGRQTRQALSDVTRETDRASRAGNQFASAFGNAFDDLLVKGQSVSSVLKSLAADLAGVALDQTLPALFSGLGGSASGSMGKKSGGLTAFAKGGVVSGATLFSASGGMGLMGEAGPEAILPLSRAPDGRLGVASGATGRAMNVTFNVTATDAASFQRSETQIAAILQRSLARGNRNL